MEERAEYVEEHPASRSPRIALRHEAGCGGHDGIRASPDQRKRRFQGIRPRRPQRRELSDFGA
jgi:hypothetical protein